MPRFAFAEASSRSPAGAWRGSPVSLGHVVLGVTHTVLERERAHEHAHVRQYERWGPFFLPLYVASSGLALMGGGKPYLDNAFERQARAAQPPAKQGVTSA